MTLQTDRRHSRKAWQQERNAARRVRWAAKGVM
jgi:hypothetical protein